MEDELIEDNVVYDHDPQLPGSATRTDAIKARLKREAEGEDGLSEATRSKMARSLRIHNASGE